MSFRHIRSVMPRPSATHVCRKNYASLWCVFFFFLALLPTHAQVSDPVISVTGVSYSQQTVTVTVSDSTSGATIRYTTNGQKPTSSSTSVASGGSLTLNQNTTLEVLAFSGSSTSNLVALQGATAAQISSSGNGDHTAILNQDGSVSAMGNNSSGQLGNGTTTASNLPTHVQSSSGTNFGGANPVRTLSSTTVYGTVTYVSGNNQSAIPYNALANPLTVQANDAQGQPLVGVPVTFSIASGGGGVGSSSFGTFSTQITVLTGSNGQASVYEVLPSTPNSQVTITAKFGGGSTVTFTENTGALTGTQLNPPTQVVAVLLPSGKTQIHWVNNDSTATSNVIQSSPDGANWTIIGSVDPTSTDFIDTASGSQLNYYIVSAINSN